MRKNIQFGILMAISILLATLANSQSQNNVYIIRLNYKSELLSQKLSLIESYPSQGAPVDYGNPLLGYNLEIVSYDNKVMMSLRFKVPAQAVLFKGLTNDVKGNSNDFNFTLYVPYFENADVINIYDSKNNRILAVPVKHSQDSLPEKADVQQAFSDSQQKISLNWIYLSLPILLVIIFLMYHEISRKGIYREMMNLRKQHNITALRNYAATTLRKGYTKQQIRNALVKNNYSKEEIEEAFRGIRFIK